MSRILMPLILLTGCIVFENNGGTQPPILCDQDGDGLLQEVCGGADCDDLNPEVHPDATERYGDDVDQDCDGSPDATVTMLRAPARSATYALSWIEGDSALGGVVETPSGNVATILYDLPAPRGEVTFLRTDLTSADGVDDAALWGERLGLVRDQAVEVWESGSLASIVPWGDVVAPAQASIPGGTVWLRCDGTSVEAVFLDDQAGERARFGLDRAATSCVVLGGEEPVVLLSGPDLVLERWYLDAEVGFSDWLRLTDRSAADLTTDGSHTFVARDGGDLIVLDRDGHATRVGEGRATRQFDVAVSGDHVLVAWIDVEGELWVGLGGIGADLVVHRLAATRQTEQIRAVLTPDSLAVAALGQDEVTLVRAAW